MGGPFRVEGGTQKLDWTAAVSPRAAKQLCSHAAGHSRLLAGCARAASMPGKHAVRTESAAAAGRRCRCQVARRAAARGLDTPAPYPEGKKLLAGRHETRVGRSDIATSMPRRRCLATPAKPVGLGLGGSQSTRMNPQDIRMMKKMPSSWGDSNSR